MLSSSSASTPLKPTSAMVDPGPSAPDFRRVAIFMAIAIFLSSALSLPLALGLLPEVFLALLVPLAQLAPLIAALFVRRSGTHLRTELALAVPSWSRLLLAVAVAVGLFSLVPTVRFLLGIAIGVPSMLEALPPVLVAVPIVLVMQSVFAIGEEVGWRGWLHGQLRSLGFWPMALLIGAMWAVWHLPVLITLGLDGRSMITYLGTILAAAPLLSALRDYSGAVWAAVLGHGLLNSLRVALEQNTLGVPTQMQAWVLDIGTWVLWILAAWLLLRLRGLARVDHPGSGGDSDLTGG